MGKLDFSVQVLTTGYWPSFAQLDPHLSPEIVQCTRVFKDYYDKKNSKRRLTWMFSLGNATVRGAFVCGMGGTSAAAVATQAARIAARVDMAISQALEQIEQSLRQDGFLRP